MTPKTRLTVSITAITGAVAVALSVLSLYWLADSRFREVYEVARISAESVKTYLLQHVREHATLEPGAGLDEATAAWREAARANPRVEAFLLSTVATSPSLVEILVAGRGDTVLVASNPDRLGATVPPAPDLDSWNALPAWDKLREVMAPAHDLEFRLPLAAGGAGEPVFTVRVVVSTALVREAVVPQIRGLTIATIIGLLTVALLAWFLSSLAARPLARVSQFIDVLAEGKDHGDLPPAAPDTELAGLQSKLTLLGDQLRGAARLDQMIERLQDAVLLFDAQSRLVMGSQAADRFLAGPRWELIGRPLAEAFRHDDPLGALVRSAVELHRPIRSRLIEWRQPDGSALRIAVSVEILTDFPDRRPLGAVITISDPAPRRQLESQIDSAHRREAFGRLLRGVAHEIKNPLNSLYTHIQLLQLELGEKVPEAQRELDVIAREIKTLDHMVVTLLDFTRPLDLSLEETDLTALAREITGLVRPQAEGKGIEISLRAPAAPVTIQADRALIRQALLNVVTNAVECMAEPGAITLSVSMADSSATLSVSDQGPGIPEEIRDQIFNLYFTTKGKRGSGIGLAMTQRIAQLHDADLDVESSPEHGTTFTFRFPA